MTDRRRGHCARIKGVTYTVVHITQEQLDWLTDTSDHDYVVISAMPHLDEPYSVAVTAEGAAELGRHG